MIRIRTKVVISFTLGNYASMPIDDAGNSIDILESEIGTASRKMDEALQGSCPLTRMGEKFSAEPHCNGVRVKDCWGNVVDLTRDDVVRLREEMLKHML